MLVFLMNLYMLGYWLNNIKMNRESCFLYENSIFIV